MMTGAAVALAAGAGGLLCLERKTWAQLMLSRPIVVAPIVAAILGNVRVGFALGIPLELVFLGTASYGASTPLHETLAALFAASFAGAASSMNGRFHEATLAIAFFLSLPFALVGQKIEGTMERRNVLLIEQAEEILAHGRTGRATRHVLLSMAGTLLMGMGVTLIGTTVGLLLGNAPATLPARITQGLTYAWPLATGTAAALAIRVIKTPYAPALSAIAAVAVFVAGGLMIWSGG